MTVRAVGESLYSVSLGNPWLSLQACSQLRQPTHLVMSTRMALVLCIRPLLASLPAKLHIRYALRCHRKNSFAIFWRTLGSTRASNPAIGNPPSAAMVGASCATMPFRRVTLFCIHGATIGPCTRLRWLIVSLGDLIMTIHPCS